MILTSPLVVEKVWLDKPKYDAAERRYYERLSKSSVTSKPEASLNSSTNSDIVCSKAVSDKNIEEESPIATEEKVISEPALKTLKENKVEQVPEVCTKPKKAPEANKTITPEAKKKKKDSKSPPQKVEETKQEKEDPSAQVKKDTNVCSLPPKTEKQKKHATLPQKIDSDSIINVTNSKIGSDEILRSKVQSNAKELEGKLLQALQNNQKIDTNITEQITDVTKLKGYFLQSKNLFSQSNNSLTKGTNVNTIPEISKFPCPEKSKSNNAGKKLNQTNQQLPPLDKQESTELIIPTDSVSETVGDDQAKKETKRKKRNKKERHRDKKGITQNPNSWNSLAGEVAKARQHIKNSLQCIDDIAVTSNTVSVEVTNRLVSLEKENQELTNRMEKMEQRIIALEKALQAATAAAAAAASRPVEKVTPAPKPPAPKPSNDDDDDGVDLFGSDSDEEDAEAAKIKEQRLAEYAARKAKKPVLIAKSNIILDVKPWDDETDMKLMEAEVRKIECDGLVWGASKLVPLAYGIHKLQISCVVEDDKVSVDWLQESIEGIEDYVQSVDIAAFNKV